MSDDSVGIAVVLLLLVVIVYRRARRLFVRQTYSMPRLVIRAGLFGLLLLFLFPILSLTGGIAPTAGLVPGIALGLLAFRLTKFDADDDGLHFTPNRYIGSVVLALFVGRLIYRVLRVGKIGDFVRAGTHGMPDPNGFGLSPLTTALLFVLLGYFCSYYIAVMIRGRILTESTAQN